MQGMNDRRSFDRRSRSLIAIWSIDRRTIAIAKFNDRERKHAISILLAFFSNQPFAGQIFQKCKSLKNEYFEKKLLVALRNHFANYYEQACL